MKSIAVLIGMIIFTGALELNGQRVSSQKVNYKLPATPITKKIIEENAFVTQITILSPKFQKDDYLKTHLNEIDLIGEVPISSGIKYVSINSELKYANELGVFSATLKLYPGINTIRLVSVDEKNNIQERNLTIDCVPDVVTLEERIKKQSVYYALIIGINNYQDNILQDLDNPIRDAENLYEALIENYTFNSNNIQFLKNPTRNEIIYALDYLTHSITLNDNLLIFYAGHGWWDENSNNGYWLPSDALTTSKANWLRNSTLVDYLREINSKHTLLITDACFGGSIFKSRSAFGNNETAFEKLYELPSRKAMTSGTLTEVPDRSSFTKFLIDRLVENKNTYLSSEQLFSSFRIAVINNSNAVPQYGEIWGVGDQGGDFIFLRKE